MLLFQEYFENTFRASANKICYRKQSHYSTVTLLIYNTYDDYLLYTCSFYLRSLKISLREQFGGHEESIPSLIITVPWWISCKILYVLYIYCDLPYYLSVTQPMWLWPVLIFRLFTQHKICNVAHGLHATGPGPASALTSLSLTALAFHWFV